MLSGQGLKVIGILMCIFEGYDLEKSNEICKKVSWKVIDKAQEDHKCWWNKELVYVNLNRWKIGNYGAF